MEIPNYALREFRELVLPALLKRVGKNAFLAGEVESAVFPSDSDPEMMVQLAHALRSAHTWDSEKLVKDWPREYADIYRGKGKPRESWKSWASIPFPARSSNPLPSQDSLLVLE